ncbi:MAG: ribose 5-phosphate isomerase B [Candidatus Marinimicrobia bacterium]|nr:ribose 5-phosphate isomerase B [Candidatus Neomarinimicrobiota bacterium]|tara:strand:+ start:1167 stop:1598 length:432 start_codon:yes stop_codon:yes gene_type:complete
MKISIASDHAAYNEKQEIIKYLLDKRLDILDLGTNSEESVDYPIFGQRVAESIIDKKVDRGIVICGTGIGISIAANRYKNIRATLCNTPEHAEMARKHNDSNVLALGGRTTNLDDLKSIVDVWLSTDFEGGRHQKRINLIEKV